MYSFLVPFGLCTVMCRNQQLFRHACTRHVVNIKWLGLPVEWSVAPLTIINRWITSARIHLVFGLHLFHHIIGGIWCPWQRPQRCRVLANHAVTPHDCHQRLRGAVGRIVSRQTSCRQFSGCRGVVVEVFTGTGWGVGGGAGWSEANYSHHSTACRALTPASLLRLASTNRKVYSSASPNAATQPNSLFSEGVVGLQRENGI